jgi:riboflavin transporter FmnP
MRLQRLVRMSVLVATSVILYRFSFGLPFFPSFLKYDTSDIPVLVGALAFGPGIGVGLELMKNLLYGLVNGSADLVGLTANFAAGSLLVVGTTVVYRLSANRSWRWMAVASGAGLMTLLMIPLNTFLFLPVLGIRPTLISAMVINTLTPFNLVKGGLNAAVSLVLYERLTFALGGSRWVTGARAPRA